MNIKEAKETIQYTLQAYFQKDESGYPLVPLRQQRPILLIGLLFTKSYLLIQIGLLCFFFGVLFQLITLPVEFNASARAVRILENTGMLDQEELRGTRKVLSAAAMTYVAAAAASILSMLRLILLFGGNRRRD